MQKKSGNDILIIGFIFIISALFTHITGAHRYGDGVSYFCMADSLLRDLDLIVDNKDISRWNQNKEHFMPVGVYIKSDKNSGLKYAKPVLYPLIAAPFLSFGLAGLAFLNGLLLGGSLSIAYLFLRESFSAKDSLFFAAVFFISSFIAVYATWVSPEMMLFFFCCLCVWLGLHKNKLQSAAFICGMASGAKILFLLLLAPLIVATVLRKGRKQLFGILGMCCLGAGISWLLNFLLLGQIWPYGGERGYFFTDSARDLSAEFVKANLVNVSSQLEGVDFNSFGLFLRNLVNVFIGRFTGLIWYAFPGAVCTWFYLLYRRRLQKEQRIAGDSILAATSALILILILLRPLNYFGGRGFVGNRYFFLLPALLFLPTVKFVKNPKKAALLFLPGLFVVLPIMKNQLVTSSHENKENYARSFPYSAAARSFPIKNAPLEIYLVESFAVPRLETSEDVAFYLPLGGKRLRDKIQLDRGQETVIVRKGAQENAPSARYFKLQIPQAVLLKPSVILENRKTQEYRIFYYFRAEFPLSIKLSDSS